jgi:hypothetical protein
MISPAIIIIALMLEPAEAITQEPWDFIQPFEFIEPRTLEQIELELDRERKKQQFRVMENGQ